MLSRIHDVDFRKWWERLDLRKVRESIYFQKFVELLEVAQERWRAWDLRKSWKEFDFRKSWQEIPLLRRHVYFFLLLFLATVVASSFQEPSAPFLEGGEELPVLSVEEVYSPPSVP